MVIPKITGRKLKERFKKVKGTHGLDQWKTEELKKMPEKWWDATAEISNK